MLLRVTHGHARDNFELKLRDLLRDHLIKGYVIFCQRSLHTVFDLSISTVVRVTIFCVKSDGIILHDAEVYGLFLIPIQACLIENRVENVGF